MWLGIWLRAPGTNEAPPSASRPRNVLLVSVDTLRADALGYGKAGSASPTLDRLAAAGVRFDSARAHNVVTLPSHANMLTGLLPPDHGVRDNAGFRLEAGQETLATRLKARGYRTAAFVSAFPLDSRFGLDRGFDVYDDRFVDARSRPAMLEQERAATETVAAARGWLEQQNDGTPWFCFVHLYEPHYPYEPPAEYASRFPASAYAGEVAASDAALAPLLDPIIAADRNGRTLAIVTSDHGEALGDHGEATHGIFAYESTLRVPLILYYPPMLGARIVKADAGHVDIVPTVLEMLGIAQPSGVRGRGLLSVALGGTTTALPTYFEALSGTLNRGWAPLHGVVSGGLKYIDLPIPELYDLAADPRERRNLAAERPADVSRLRALLAPFEKPATRSTAESAEVRERLRALGYVTSGGSQTGRRYTEADDPKKLIGLDERMQEALGLYQAGRLEEARAVSRRLVAERPDMRVALLQQAHLEREAGDLPAAISALRRALQLAPADSETASLLGASLTAAGRAPEAVAVLEPFAARADADVQVLEAFALAHARAGRHDAALATLERARAADPGHARILVVIGTVHLMAGRRAAARQAFEQALAQNADMARAHSSLAALDAEDDRLDAALGHWRKAVELDPGEFQALLATAISLARSGRADDARPYMQLFADTAPASRYAADISGARAWLTSPVGR